MNQYAIYNPEDFGLHGSPNEDERYAVLVELDEDNGFSNHAMLVYICNDDWELPPFVDIDAVENFEISPSMLEGKRPVFPSIGINMADGSIHMTSPQPLVIMNERQYQMLVEPSCIDVDGKTFWLDEKEAARVFRQDETLVNIEPKRLDMIKFENAVKKCRPALLEHTHSFCGFRYPEFPNLKYFENRDCAILYIAASQLPEITERMYKGEVALYHDAQNGKDWTIQNIYGVCIIDDHTDEYTCHLISPKRLEKHKEMYQERNQEKNPVRENYFSR